jgi:hypothetical protein
MCDVRVKEPLLPDVVKTIDDSIDKMELELGSII